MGESVNTPSIYEALRFVQIELNAPKGQHNSFGNYDYRSAEDIVEAAKPVLADNNLTLLVDDEIVLIGDRYYVKATAAVFNEAGDSIPVHGYAREAEDKKGMDSAQVTGATSSYARKYALNGLLAIDDSKDADTDEHRNTSDKRESTTSNPAPKASPNKPASEKQKSMIAAIAHKVGKDNAWIDDVMHKTKTSADASAVIEKLQALENSDDMNQERQWK